MGKAAFAALRLILRLTMLCAPMHVTPELRVARGVGQQVDDHLREADLVAIHIEAFVRQRDRHRLLPGDARNISDALQLEKRTRWGSQVRRL